MRLLSWFGILFICFVSGGATCAPRTAPIPFPPPPTVLNDAPSLEQISSVVNRSQAIRQLSTNSATVKMLSMPSLPKLNATMHVERDKSFRLRASLPIVMGAGMDMGSNDEVFWFEVPEGMSKTLYYARHDQYRQQLERAILPVDPSWVMDALGLVQIDPTTVDAGPVRRPDGRYEVSSMISMPNGIYHRICFIDSAAGHVTDQYLYSPSGQLIAESHASRHAYYEQFQCSLPHVVEVKLTPNLGPPLEMKIEVGAYTVNQLLVNDPNVFSIPTSASNMVDLTSLSSETSAGGQPLPSSPVNYSAQGNPRYPLRGQFR